MGNCPNCGKKKLFLVKTTCSICGKNGCSECFKFLFRVLEGDGGMEELYYACSEKCLDKVAGEIESQIDPKEIVPTNEIPPVRFFVERVVLQQYASKVSSSLMGQLKNRLQKKVYRVSFAKDFADGSPPTGDLWERLVKHTRLIQASHFETLREFENAAKIYKSLGMYEKAGETRAKRDELTIKNTNISVNLNALLQQIKDGGIVAVFRCPNCGGKLKISDKTTLNSLKECEYCRSEITSMDLADFLKTVLS